MRKAFLYLLSCAFCASAHAAKPNTSITIPPLTMNYGDKGGLTISDVSGSYRAKFSGYVEADGFKSQRGIAGFDSGTNIRRARLNLGGTIATDWGYAVGYEARTKDLTNGYIAYKGFRNMQFTAGQFYPNVSFVNWLTTTDINFLEIPMTSAVFIPNFGQGIDYRVNTQQLMLEVSGYSAGTQDTVTGRSPISSAMRFIYSPFHAATQALDLGFSTWYTRPDSNKTVTYSAVPEVKNRNTDTVISTGAINNVAYTGAGGLEAAYIQGPWSAEAEYIRQWVIRDSGSDDLHFDGYYITGAYFLTGESLSYSFPDAAIWGTTPIQNPTWGAWEIATQFSHLNLSNQNVRGGKEDNASLGLNWFANQFVELKLDYIYVMASPTKLGTDKNDNLIGLRAQIRF